MLSYSSCKPICQSVGRIQVTNHFTNLLQILLYSQFLPFLFLALQQYFPTLNVKPICQSVGLNSMSLITLLLYCKSSFLLLFPFFSLILLRHLATPRFLCSPFLVQPADLRLHQGEVRVCLFTERITGS